MRSCVLETANNAEIKNGRREKYSWVAIIKEEV